MRRAIPAARRLPGHRLPLDELEHHHTQIGQVRHHRRADSRLGGGGRVHALVHPIDRQQVGRCPRDPHHVLRPVGLDEVVVVCQAPGERRNLDVLLAPQLDAADHLVDRDPRTRHQARIRALSGS